MPVSAARYIGHKRTSPYSLAGKPETLGRKGKGGARGGKD